MKPILKNSICLLFSATLLTGCATTTDVAKLRREIRMLNRKVEEMKSGTVGNLERRQASATGHMEQLQQDIDDLRSQVEESYYLSQQLREQNKELQDSISTVAQEESSRREQALQQLQQDQAAKEAKIRELDGLLRKQEANVQAIQKARIREAERKAKAAALEAKMAGKRSSRAASQTRKAAAEVQNSGFSTPSPSRSIRATRKKVVHKTPERVTKTATAPTTLKSTPAAPATTVGNSTAKKTGVPAPLSKTRTTTPTVAAAPAAESAPAARPVFTGAPPAETSALTKGRKLLAQKKYDGAVAALEKIAGDTSSKERIEANFLIGQARFAQKDYVAAVNNFQVVISQSPGSRMAPQAILRQAQCFEKLVDFESARGLYKVIEKKYSSSPEAATARQRLQKL